MAALLPGPLSPLLLLLSLSSLAAGQDFGERCLAQHKHGRVDFILDADGSVKDGATFLSAPEVTRDKDCVVACCKHDDCNVSFMKRDDGGDEGRIQSCFLFNCLYKKKYVCRFVKKTGYLNYFLDTVYDSDVAVDSNPDQADGPPVANGGSDRVVQPQDGLTLNGIESKDDHGIDSFRWHLVSGNTYAVIEKTNFKDQVIVTNLTSGVYKFQLTVIDTSGQVDSTVVTVLVLTPEQSDHHCMAPAKVGACRGRFPRWHYNGASNKCEMFIYGGCRGNLNNYLTIQECANACEGSEANSKSSRGLPVTPIQGETCGAPCTEGEYTCANGCCLSGGLDCEAEPRCTDGSDKEYCEHCEWGRCKLGVVCIIDHSKINFKFDIRFYSSHVVPPPFQTTPARCTEPLLTGGCRHRFTKWYYDPMQRKCNRFNYGGCHGNDNKFDTEEQCMAMCSGVTEDDVFARKEAYEKMSSEHHPAIMATAILLGIAIIALLAVLGYCFLKGKKRPPQHQRVATNGNQVTTREDTERLVYNSTTKPI
ncbi:Kunitz-type protease inhibitor 1 [Merluccius polli]|uniref:Kunitz-type protease inhibitor 1 n=1 Tax=Merluccius polli TaxID=89951 RepID=A0AA47NNL3_MERPO|nr:Kunitz-type protease inhibitor 1 [Merluccius polli]